MFSVVLRMIERNKKKFLIVSYKKLWTSKSSVTFYVAGFLYFGEKSNGSLDIPCVIFQRPHTIPTTHKHTHVHPGYTVQQLHSSYSFFKVGR